MSWEAKVHRVIARLAATAHRQSNTDRAGKRYKRHRPYRLPEAAEQLVRCLGDRDRSRGERACKATMEQLRREGVKID
jgi:hypothetical protein